MFFDGTLYTDDEMLVQGLMPKTGNRMGHISISGPEGSIAAFRDLGVARKIYVHINNSNPVLDELSPERRATERAGWEVGFDGMEIRAMSELAADNRLWSVEEFDAAIRAVGAERYHDKHPFHKLLHGGKLNKGQVQAWALNRYCYQSAVPRKDAALISRTHDRALRREWLHRVHDHDGIWRGAGRN